jgi:hypothetical protein
VSQVETRHLRQAPHAPNPTTTVSKKKKTGEENKCPWISNVKRSRKYQTPTGKGAKRAVQLSPVSTQPFGAFARDGLGGNGIATLSLGESYLLIFLLVWGCNPTAAKPQSKEAGTQSAPQ